MAKSDESRHEGSAPKRVFKSSDVHKRRVDRKTRPDLAKLPKVTKDSAPSRRRLATVLPEISKTESEADTPPAKPDDDITSSQIESQAPQSPQASDAAPPPGADIASESENEPEARRESLESEERADERPRWKRIDRGNIAASATGWLVAKKRAIVIVVALVVVLVLCAGGFFAWSRWLRCDDNADMQGEWYVAKTAVPVQIDAQSIYLTDNVTYQYEINAHDKTIAYTFGPMKGQGRYWFSDDRKSLAITDGEGYTASGTAFEDFLRAFEDFATTSSGGVVMLPEGDGIIVLCREPDPVALAAREAEEKEARERAAAEARAQEQEAAENAANGVDGYGYAWVDQVPYDYGDVDAGVEGAAQAN